MRPRPALALALGWAVLMAVDGHVRGADADAVPVATAKERTGALKAYARAEAPPAKAKLLLNTVLLSTSGFERKGTTYETGYSAKVSPLSFLSETGKLTIDVTDDQLRQLERGETVPFTGLAVSKGGDRHTIAGTAVPADKTQGTLRVRISTAIVELKFETTYRFIEAPAPAAP